ncbi:MAG: hypothetical protein KC609_19135 [Myxococcales bacterium]|nr:hypothetical protein [Myxococcales bacterium]
MKIFIALFYGVLAATAYGLGAYLAFELERGLKRGIATALYGAASGFLAGALTLDALGAMARLWSGRVFTALILVLLGYVWLLGVNALLARSFPIRSDRKLAVHLPRGAAGLVALLLSQALIVSVGVAISTSLGFALALALTALSFVDSAALGGQLLATRTPRERIKQLMVAIVGVSSLSGLVYFATRSSAGSLIPLVVGMLIFVLSRAIPEVIRKRDEMRRSVAYVGAGLLSFGLYHFITRI